MSAQHAEDSNTVDSADTFVSVKTYVEVVAAAATLAGIILYGAGWFIVGSTLSPLGVTPEEIGVSWSWLLVRVAPLALLLAVVVAVTLLLVYRGPWWVQLLVLALWILSYALSESVLASLRIVILAAGIPIFAVLLYRAVEVRRSIRRLREDLSTARDRATPADEPVTVDAASPALDALGSIEKQAAPKPWITFLAVLLVAQSVGTLCVNLD
jgi:hypothetical protein